MSTRPKAEPDDRGKASDWFGVLDILVWVAVIIVVAVGLDLLFGKIMRERLASGASRYLDKVNSARGEPTA